MNDSLVLGLDVGGSTSRAVVTDLAGRQIGRGVGRGGNPTSHPTEAALAAIDAALRAALTTIDQSRIRAGVIGLAGGGTLHGRLESLWPAHGITCPIAVFGDAVVAFAAATPVPAGTVLIAGTGAIACRIVHRRADRIADGHGWLLGDRGSGFWLGLRAVRAALADTDGTGPATALTSAVRAKLATTAELTGRAAVAAMITAVHTEPPIALARFAPLVNAAARAGDPVATGLIDRAAHHLVHAAAAVRYPAEDTPIVIAGGAVAPGEPLTERVTTELTTRWPRAPLAPAGDGAAGAAWLAAVSIEPAAAHPSLRAEFIQREQGDMER